MNTCEILKALRKEQGATLEDIGKQLGITKSALQKYESGEVKNIKLNILKKICLLYDITPVALVFPEYAHLADIKLSQTTDPDCVDFLKRYELLSYTGKKKVMEYTNDILQIPHYRAKQ